MGTELNAKTQGREDARDIGDLASLSPGDLALSEGFRDTPLGPLPETWEVLRLGDLGDIITGRTPPTDEERYWLGGSVPFITPVDLRGGPIRTAERAITYKALEASRPLPRGAVLVSCIGYIGKVGVVDNPIAVTNQQINAVIPNESKAHNWYLAFALTFLGQELKSRARVTTVPILSKSNFEATFIPLPPLTEQCAVAHVLRTVQEAREATERIVAAARELKRSLMRHLFTYGPLPVAQADQVELRETEVGPIPAHWRTTRLAEVTEKPQYGYTASATEEPVGPKLLRITDIQDGRVMWGTVPYCDIGEKDIDKYLLSPGDILIARIGATTGKTYLVTQCPESVFASYLIRVRVRPGLIASEYLHHFTNTQGYWTQINASKGGRLKQGVNIPVLQSLLLPLPPLLEQDAIARALATVDAKIAAEEGRRGALEALFHSLLHHLMTGKIRTQGRKDAKTQSKT